MKPTAYVIDLDRRPDRWATMQEAWSFWFNLVRISAVDLPGNGAGGCRMSHYMVAATFLQRNEPIVVFEDDATPTTAFGKIGMRCLGEAALCIDDWRIVNLGPYLDVSCLGLGRANLKPTTSEYFLSASYCQQTHMMMYNRKSLPILEEALKSTLPLDVYIGRLVNEIWVPVFLLATQSDSPSDIPKPRVDAKALYELSERMLEDAVNEAKHGIV